MINPCNLIENSQFVKLDFCVPFYWTVIRNPKRTQHWVVRLTHKPRALCYGDCSPISRCFMSLGRLMNGAFCCQLLLLVLMGQTDLTLLISGSGRLKEEMIRALRLSR